ncbi:29630_t:CDS:2, partial [Racocetra persica]
DSNKKCNTQLKVSSGLTSNLISHLSSKHGITQDGPGLPPDENKFSKSDYEHVPPHREFSESDYEQASTYIDEDEARAEVSKSPSTQSGVSNKTNYFKKKGGNATCDFCNMSLVYHDGTISNLKKHLKAHRSKVPELKSLN